ncbi:purine-binding chemotaxis protein CheW [Fulvivirga sp. 29W222]|uniref:Purine-binding chemotaxis protein CheW n=1 Tax=Fulvivirga marina TaxID=2494733 RepID=A0A937KFX0_9BACT|nr:chemotaxis protein CheW [Fulvivirga marina]MBL6448593.1 purine-binding chemotaxis protein CheW [Fulvivirga marina]
MNYEIDTAKALKSFLSFKLADKTFALEVEKVIEIIEVPKITSIPKAPAHMKGVINLRGQVLPLIDTCVKFGLPAIEPDLNTCIIVIDLLLKEKTIRFGAMVSQVLEVLEKEEDHIHASPSIEANYNLEFVKGIIKENEDFIVVLDIDKTFSVEEVKLMKNANEKKTETSKTK